MTFPYPLITLEEHFLAQSVRDFYDAHGTVHPDDFGSLGERNTPLLLEFGEKRLESMDESGVSLQIVSHVPNVLALDLATCVQANNELSERIKGFHPDRFRGFAILPMNFPEDAGNELRRCVKDLGFVGTLVDSNVEGTFYDNDFFWPVFETAVELDVPVYIHPSVNSGTKPLLFEGNYPANVAESLSQYGWGWHSETAISFLRLFAAGVFDQFPRLKIVLGHLGEMLTFQLDRIEGITNGQWPHIGSLLQRTLRQVWDENVWITSSGMFSLTPMAAVVRQCKLDRIMYSVDYPYDQNEHGLAFLQALKAEGMVSDEALEGIAHKNAEALLKVTAT